MMEELGARGAALGAAGVERAVVRVAEAAGALPGVAVAIEGDDVVLSGRGLGRRMLEEPELRWIGGMR